jgi:chaperonin GroES
MAIETDNPINEEIDIEEEAVVSLPEDGEEEVAEETEAEDFFENIAETIDDKALKQLASDLISEYDSDKESRKDWEDTYRNGLDLLGFKYKSTTQPFKGASNVTHPLLAEAVTQFQSQAYKELLPSDGPVKTKIVGLQNEEVEAQAERVKDFMNYQIMEKMEEYTPDFDQLLFYLPLAGSAFKKIYYDSILERAVSKFIPAEDLVVPYYATDLKDAPRITHVLKQSENDLLKKMASGLYMEVDLMKPQKKEDKIQDKYNELEGIKPVETDDYIYTVLEMHVDLDLSDYISEGEDSLGIKIPYIVTIEESTRQILSIYRNYDKDDGKFLRKEYFAHFKFLPGLGFYGFGLIHMIGGLSRTATTALRQLLDAGTLSNLPAGFKSRGMRIRDDDQPIQPGEFRDVDAPGGNIRDQFQLLPFKEPSAILFNLLGFCVDAGRRFASIADNPVADMNSQAPVGTTIALLERGSRVISAIHKRCYYAMKQEFKLLANVISEYLPPEYPYSVYGAERVIKLLDFDDRVDILPVADPNIFSMSQRVTLAQTQLQIAQSNPQLHNLHEAYRRVYEALGTKEIPQLLKPEVKPMPEDPAMENMKAMQMQSLVAFPEQDHDAHIAAHSAFMRTRMVQINPTVYANLQGHISQHVSLKASAEVQQMMMQNPQMMQLSQENPQAFQNMLNSEIAKRIAQITSELAQAEMQADGAKQDPIVMLKQRELDLRAMDLQRRSQEGTIKIENQEDQFEDRLDFDKMKLEQNDDQSDARLEVAREKMQLTQKKQEKKNG